MLGFHGHQTSFPPLLLLLLLDFLLFHRATAFLLLRGSCLFTSSHRGGQVALFLPFHTSVLEPDFDLPLRQTKRVGDLDASAPGQVAVEMKLLLQLECLIPGVYLTSPASV